MTPEETTGTTGNGHADPPLAVTSPEAYPGYEKAELHSLPSGAIFKLRTPQLMRMVRRGQIPNPLMDIVHQVFSERDETEIEALAKERGVTVDEVREQLDREKMEKGDPPDPPTIADVKTIDALEFTDVVVWAAIVEPRVEFEPAVGDTPLTATGALAFDAISEQDHSYILRFANEGMAGVARFREELGREGDGRDSGAVRAEAERPAGDPAGAGLAPLLP